MRAYSATHFLRQNNFDKKLEVISGRKIVCCVHEYRFKMSEQNINKLNPVLYKSINKLCPIWAYKCIIRRL